MAIPITLCNNLIFVEAKINGSMTGDFIFDTGSSITLVDSSFAAVNNIAITGKIKSTSTGQEFPVADNLTFAFNEVKTAGIMARIFDTSQLSSVIGHRIDGIIGYDFLEKFVVEFDYAGLNLAFYDPKQFRYQGKGEKLPLSVEAKWPFITCTLAQGNHCLIGKILLDSGSLMGLSIKCLDLADSTIPFPISFGIGGSGGGLKLGRLSSLSFGSCKIFDPIAGFPADTNGPYDPLTTKIYELGLGLIGSEILRRFTVTLDYTHNFAYFAPNRNFPDPVEFDMSGLTIITTDKDHKQFVVIAVTSGSPAEAADVQVGDCIIEINNVPAANYSLDRIREMFKLDNASYKLKILRGEETKEFSFTTRRMI